ncbi:LtrC-like protein [Weissella oryzae SG25]|uniref:LtrC-like protein n=1 Tax=Weissella oryzae (strain DSM 25784 / JCM 18191 / LMG 30913 / SG25) TaxID=1329250 RepID=A0A069D0F4_WEIOS|nr:hypothetical protein [Weissella oryzae]GAK30771.1 LtrC-like protein [Weissella oryzae SG25]
MFLKLTDKQFETHKFLYPWDYEAIGAMSKAGVRKAEMVGLVANNLTVEIAPCDLEGSLSIFINIIKYLRVYKVVYAPSTLEAVKLIFDSDLSEALYSLVTNRDIKDNLVSVISKPNWQTILDLMLDHQRLKSLGYGFYADICY